MATALKTVQDALRDALLQPPALFGGRVYSGRDRALPPEHANDAQISVGPFTAEAVSVGGGPLLVNAEFRVSVRARGSDTSTAADALDPLLSAVQQRLSGTPAPAGVLSWSHRISGRPDMEEAGSPIASLDLSIAVMCRATQDTMELYP